MSRNLGELLDIPSDGNDSKNFAQTEQQEFEPAQAKGKRLSLFTDTAQETPSSQPEEQDNQRDDTGNSIGMGVGTAASGYAGYKANKFSTLPSKFTNVQDNLNLVNKTLNELQDKHAQNLQNLNDAKAYHDYMHSDKAVNDYLPEQYKNQSAPVMEEPKLTPKPAGGDATANYAKKFGATDFQASNNPSMSAVQQQMIPENAKNITRMQAIEPNAIHVEESPLVLDPAAQRAKLAQMQAEQAANSQKISDVEKAKLAVQSSIEKPRAEATANLVKAQSEANKSANALSDLTARQARLSGKLADSASELPVGLQNAATNIGENSGKMANIARASGKIFNKVATPLTAAAIPYDVNQAYNDAKNGDVASTVKHGTGALAGLMSLAPAAAAAGMIAPPVGAALGAAGLVGGLALGAQDLYENRDTIYDKGKELYNKYFNNK